MKSLERILELIGKTIAVVGVALLCSLLLWVSLEVVKVVAAIIVFALILLATAFGIWWIWSKDSEE